MHLGRTTLSKFLIQQVREHHGEEGAGLAALLVDIAAAVKAISAMTAKGDVIACRLFCRLHAHTASLADGQRLWRLLQHLQCLAERSRTMLELVAPLSVKRVKKRTQ